MANLVAQLIRARWAHFGALGVVLLSLLLPPDRGFGVPLCQFRLVTHLPCLACGLTRSFIALAHLNLGRAIFYHPLGLLLFPATLALASLLLAPKAYASRCAGWIERRPQSLNRLGIGLLVISIGYGVGRIGWLLITHRPSPW